MSKKELEKRIEGQENKIKLIKELLKEAEDILFCLKLELKDEDKYQSVLNNNADYFSIWPTAVLWNP